MAETTVNYLDPSTIDKIRRLDVRARLVVEGFITGMHRSPYHGFAVEFATHREYVPGDEIKHIDWKLWSRTDRLYIKEYEEETNLTCHLIVDASKSMQYGGGGRGVRKFDYAATVAACFAHLLQQQQDSVGLVTFDTKVRKQLPPSSHPNHLKQLVHELEQTDCDDATDLDAVFPEVAERVRKRGMVVILSDLFVDLEALGEAMKRLRHRRHEVILFQVLHHDERTFPFDDMTQFRGLEIDTQLLAEPRALRKSYLEAMEHATQQIRRRCAAYGVDHVMIDTSEPLDAALARYLAFRQQATRAWKRGSR